MFWEDDISCPRDKIEAGNLSIWEEIDIRDDPENMTKKSSECEEKSCLPGYLR